MAILHDNGVCEKSLHGSFIGSKQVYLSELESKKEHCTIGEQNLVDYPFLTNVTDVIKYHHERFDGSGFFNLKGDDIPIMSQIIRMADMLESIFDLKNADMKVREQIYMFIRGEENKTFSPVISDAFLKSSNNTGFWLCLKDNSIDVSLKSSTPRYSIELSYEAIHKVTCVLSRIIDSKSQYTRTHSEQLSQKVAVLVDYYGIEHEDKMKLVISADLHDLGKLAVPNMILDSPSKLSNDEFEIIKEHPYYTKLALQNITGFEDIARWAGNHNEKLNGEGYPFGLSEKDLDFNSRILSFLIFTKLLLKNDLTEKH